MNWINYYLSCQYVDGGREPPQIDCFGLVRHARHNHCGMALLPSFGQIRNTQPREFTEAYRTTAESVMEECEPEHGAVASVFRGGICIHVALVIKKNGTLYTLDINPKKGARFQRLADFESQYLKVLYYRDKDLRLQVQ